ncbi:MAG: His-Xaa-Ser system protein HxsD [bacterium]|nr:His-Xaa-Ser system protein HxsD [bacterium]
MKFQINSPKNQITFFLDSKLYPIEAIYGAAYVFIDRAYIFLDGDPQKEIIICLKGKKKMNFKELEGLQGEFYNELLNYLLRVKIAKRNKKVRDFIVGTALVSGSNIFDSSPDGSDNDYLDDPLGIAVPWEDKYKENTAKKKKQDETSV